MVLSLWYDFRSFFFEDMSLLILYYIIIYVFIYNMSEKFFIYIIMMVVNIFLQLNVFL